MFFIMIFPQESRIHNFLKVLNLCFFQVSKISNKRQSEVAQRKDMKAFNGLKAILD